MGLPTSFIALLSQPLPVVLDELVPLPVPKKVSEPSKKETTKKTSAFLDALATMPKGTTTNRTGNGALAHASTGEALLDLFNDLAPNFDPENLFTRLAAAWDVDPET